VQTTAQLARVDSVTGAVTPVGKPGLFQTVAPAPDGKHLLVARIHRPYSYLYTYTSFPKDVEVWDLSGKVVHTIAKLPLQDAVPVDGVPTGPRSYAWNPVQPATLVWVEALDGGDPKTKVPHRDRILSLGAPFAGEPQEFMRIEQRYAGLDFFDEGGYAFVSDYERERR
jgi:dipeptidyl aminopeptidase/acylaminoacyl peptidase